VVDSLKALDPKRPIREADIWQTVSERFMRLRLSNFGWLRLHLNEPRGKALAQGFKVPIYIKKQFRLSRRDHSSRPNDLLKIGL
jgi:hypothetical protein